MAVKLGGQGDGPFLTLPTSTTDQAALAAYLCDTLGMGARWIAGTTDTSPLASMDLFSITGGLVRVFEIVGYVTTVIETQACNMQIVYDPDDGGADIDLCTALDISADVTGAIYRITGDVSDAIIDTLDIAEATPSTNEGSYMGIIMSPGDIKVTYADTNTGVIDWYIHYESIGGGTIVAG
ncbi:hypothetical protein LCGC14_0412470 [marine sediment metagenome]|uniref:Uncharacterized protein n=1 Tax=marine sediment metagenome TaxID=412755 RepID=A0A0F9VFG2_9ZZZZ